MVALYTLEYRVGKNGLRNVVKTRHEVSVCLRTKMDFEKKCESRVILTCVEGSFPWLPKDRFLEDFSTTSLSTTTWVEWDTPG